MPNFVFKFFWIIFCLKCAKEIGNLLSILFGVIILNPCTDDDSFLLSAVDYSISESGILSRHLILSKIFLTTLAKFSNLVRETPTFFSAWFLKTVCFKHLQFFVSQAIRFINVWVRCCKQIWFLIIAWIMTLVNMIFYVNKLYMVFS